MTMNEEFFKKYYFCCYNFALLEKSETKLAEFKKTLNFNFTVKFILYYVVLYLKYVPYWLGLRTTFCINVAQSKC